MAERIEIVCTLLEPSGINNEIFHSKKIKRLSVAFSFSDFTTHLLSRCTQHDYYTAILTALSRIITGFMNASK